jgi:hypothetical protein
VEPSSSPPPGASAAAPLWTAEARNGAGRAAGVLDLVLKAITLGYAVLGAWQLAKALRPELQVAQDIAFARVRARVGRRPPELLAELPAGAARPLYDDTR